MFKAHSNAIPALVTAFDDSGGYAPELQKDLVNLLNTQGADGYFVAGTSGECYHLSLSEKRSLCQDVAELAGGRQVVLHVSSADPRETQALTREADILGATAIAVGAPPYFVYDEKQMWDYLVSLKNLTQLPVFYYFIPSLGGPLLPHQFLERAFDEGIVQGVKYSDTDLLTMSRLIAARPSFKVFVGSDDLVLAGCAMGAVGAVGSGFNVALPLVVSLFDALDDGDLDRARAAQQRLCKLTTLMEGFEFITFLKALLRHQGLNVGQARPPIRTTPPDASVLTAASELITDSI
ncbi:dihydrodipicolinate synthase family protein [Bowdeniella massiliensis]|uniref:dihydrodipicolinate synthase family protein n=1 Tax=Bowdeniella massiliensis TaxID=2932264 RepID=UPI00202875B5